LQKLVVTADLPLATFMDSVLTHRQKSQEMYLHSTVYADNGSTVTRCYSDII